MGLELGTDDPRRRKATPGQQRRAAVRVADSVGVEHPHPLDDLMPRLAGQQVGRDPEAAGKVRDLLAALGLDTAQEAS